MLRRTVTVGSKGEVDGSAHNASQTLLDTLKPATLVPLAHGGFAGAKSAFASAADATVDRMTIATQRYQRTHSTIYAFSTRAYGANTQKDCAFSSRLGR